MGELRRDYFTNKVVLTSSKNDKKLKLKKQKEQPKSKIKKDINCNLCPGNEKNNSPADLVLVQSEGMLMKMSDEDDEPVQNWVVRIFPSEYPVVKSNPELSFSEKPLYSEPAYGQHYIVVTSPNHNESFSEMSIDQSVSVLTSVQDKVRELYNQKKVSYVVILINQGEKAGALYEHPHIEIITLPILPPIIEQEAIAIQKSMYDFGICPMCNVVNIESGGPRQILATEKYVAIAPWASSQDYEFWIIPKLHKTSFLKSTQKEISDLSMIIRCTLGGLSKSLKNPAFNLVFHLSSEKKSTRQIHWHLEVYPQVNNFSGIERGMGVHINRINPEQVAEELGKYSRKELSKIIGIL